MNGKIDYLSFKSKILQDNPLGDPSIRDLIVYTPPGYDAHSNSKYPVVILLPPFGNDNYSLLKHDPFSHSIIDRLEKLCEGQKCGKMIIIVVNCFNRLGGSQYINSPAIGKYEDYLIKEIIPFIDKNFNVSKKAIMGKSSGGYGALVLGMRHPDLFNAVAAHSFDSGFEYCYIPDFPAAIRTLDRYDKPSKWLEEFWNVEDKRTKDDFATMNILSMSAHYSPSLSSTDLGLDLPFDTSSGNFKMEVWERWKQNDPVNLLDELSENLKKIGYLYLDCGINDEFNLHIGTKSFSQKCHDLGIKHDYLVFQGGHFNTNYRFDISLPKINEALS